MKVFIIAAISLDGFIGIDENHRSTSWTSNADTQFFIKKTKEAGTVVMGRKTFNTFNKALKDRRLIIYTYEPNKIQIEGVEATNEDPKNLIDRLEKEGVNELAIAGGRSIYTLFIKAKVVNELYITVMPKIFGEGLPLFRDFVDKNIKLIDSKILEDGNSVLLHYLVENPNQTT